jgi:hypothetical protein
MLDTFRNPILPGPGCNSQRPRPKPKNYWRNQQGPVVRVIDEGWLELTCPAPGARRCVTFERRKIRVDGPAGCHLLRDLRDAEAR